MSVSISILSSFGLSSLIIVALVSAIDLFEFFSIKSER